MSKKTGPIDNPAERPDEAAKDAGFDEAAAIRAESLDSDAAGQHEPYPDPVAVPPNKSIGFVAWLALFTALFALVIFGVDLLADRNDTVAEPANNSAIDAVSSSLRSLQDSLDTVQQSVNGLVTERAAINTEIAAIERRFSDRLRQIESVSGRMSTLESTVSALQGISTGARDAWLLAEAEYYMQIANAELQLARNPELARMALALADERILQLANPALTAVRRALSDELRALERMDKPDTAGMALTLASLAEVVDALPLLEAVDEPTTEDNTLDPELTGSSRALASLQSAISKAVSVRRVDEAVRPFIAPEAQYFLRANLALQLQAARLAMLRGEPQLFDQSLDDAAKWLAAYYDTESTPVRSALQTIADIRGSALSVAFPDISESLRLLRQFNALADANSRLNVPPAGIAAEPEQ